MFLQKRVRWDFIILKRYIEIEDAFRLYLIVFKSLLRLQILDLLKHDTAKPDQLLVYSLTLGVVESYKNF